MNQELIQLDREVESCRRKAQADVSSPCHRITQFKCHAYGDKVGTTIPNPAELDHHADILVVGINPNCSKPLDEPASETDCRKGTGKTYHAYL